MELTEHLAELRSRILRCMLYLLVGATLAYQVFTPLYGFLYRPLVRQMKLLNIKAIQYSDTANGVDPLVIPQVHPPLTQQQIADQLNRFRAALLFIRQHPVSTPVLGNVFHGFYEPFTVRLKLSILFGFILTTPLIVGELALFIAPALTPQELRPLRILIPISIALLIFGIAVAYCTMFYAMAWFLSYLTDFPHGAALMQDPNDYIVFFVKMLAAFGVAFQLPVVLMGGAFLGFITSKGLLKHWRWGVVIAALGGVFTPSNDLISMALMAIPLLILYFFSVLLVRMVEAMKARDLRRKESP